MPEWFSELGNGVQFWLVIAAAVILIVAIVAGTRAWQTVRVATERRRLVQSLADRGLSADEIGRVLIAAQLDVPAAEDHTPEVRIVQVLTEASYEAEDISRILPAARRYGVVSEETLRIVESLAEGDAEADHIIAVLNARGGDGACGPHRSTVAGATRTATGT